MRTLGTVRPNNHSFRVLSKRYFDDLIESIEGASRTDLIKRPSNRGEGWNNSLVNVRPDPNQSLSFVLETYLYQRTLDELQESTDSTITVKEISGVARSTVMESEGDEQGVACEFIFQGDEHSTPVPVNLSSSSMTVEIVVSEVPSSVGSNSVTGELLYEGTRTVLGFPVVTLAEGLSNGDRAVAFNDSWLLKPNSDPVDLSGRAVLMWRKGAPVVTGSSALHEGQIVTLDGGEMGVLLPPAFLTEELGNIAVLVQGIYVSSEVFPVVTVNEGQSGLLSFSSHVASGTFDPSLGMGVGAYANQWVIPSISEWTGRNQGGRYLGAFISQNLYADSDGKTVAHYRPYVVQSSRESDGSSLMGVENNDSEAVLRVAGRGLQDSIFSRPLIHSDRFMRVIADSHGNWASKAWRVHNLHESASAYIPIERNEFNQGGRFEFNSGGEMEMEIIAPYVNAYQFVYDDVGPFNDTFLTEFNTAGFFGLKGQTIPHGGLPLLSWDFSNDLFDRLGYDSWNHPKTGANYSTAGEYFTAFGPEACVTIRVPFNPPHGFQSETLAPICSMNFKGGTNPLIGDPSEFISYGAFLEVSVERFSHAPQFDQLRGTSWQGEVIAYAKWSGEDFISDDRVGATVHELPQKGFGFRSEDRLRGDGIWSSESFSLNPKYYLTLAIRPPQFANKSFALSGLQFYGVHVNLAQPDHLL